MTSTTTLTISSSPGERRIAAFTGNQLIDFAVWRPNMPDGYGDIYIARVQKSRPDMGGVFFTLPYGHGFLPNRRLASVLKEGELHIVKVVRSSIRNKDVRLALVTNMPLPYQVSSPILLKRGPNIIEEFLARYPAAEVKCDTPFLAADIRRLKGAHISVATTLYDEHQQEQISCLYEDIIHLNRGVSASFTLTPAAFVIDMDFSPTMEGKENSNDLHFRINRDTLPVIMDQIKLRNLSGALLIDPAGLPQRKRKSLRPIIEKAVESDSIGCYFLGFSALGLIELQRTRTRPSLHELCNSPYGQGLRAIETIRQQNKLNPPNPCYASLPASLMTTIATDVFVTQDFKALTGCPLILSIKTD